MNEAQITWALIEMRKNQLAEALPQTAAGLDRFREGFGTTLRYSLMAEFPDPDDIQVSEAQPGRMRGLSKEDFVISRRGREDRVALTSFRPAAKNTANSSVLLVVPDTANGGAGGADHLIELLAGSGHNVTVVHCFHGGRKIPEKVEFFTTYNRTDGFKRVFFAAVL